MTLYIDEITTPSLLISGLLEEHLRLVFVAMVRDSLQPHEGSSVTIGIIALYHIHLTPSTPRGFVCNNVI